MSKIGVVGSGIVGRGWSIVFARAGHQVSLFDSDRHALQAALEEIGRSLALLEQYEPDFSAGPVMDRIRPCASLEELADTAVHIQENIPELAGSKTALFQQLDRLAGPDTILASSSSSLPPSAFLASIPGRHRCLVAHPGNPPHLIPIVELVPGPWTLPELTERTASLLRDCGKTIIRLACEIPGFVFNRLQGALVAEAIRIVDKGVVSAEDVELCVREGLGFRWAVTGPFETMDLASQGGFAESARKYGSMVQILWPGAETWSSEAGEAINRWCRSGHSLEEHARRERLRDSMLIRLQQVKSGVKSG